MMKTIKQTFSVTLLLLIAAASNSFAQGDIVTNAAAGQAFTITSTQNASAVNAVRYQWYRNGAPIPGATGASYTIPAAYAYGDMVRFQRMATTQECAGVSEAFANSVTITFTGFVTPAGCNLVIGGVCWANTNVGTFRNFAPRADQYTEFYQWGNTTAWSASDPLTPAWTIVNNDAVTWDPAWDPCPMGWRMPSQAEMQALIGSGHSWVDANVRGTAVIGAFIGYNNTTCQLPNNMQGCIFIPAAGYRANNNGTLLGRLVSDNPRVHLWTSTPTANTQSVYGSIVATGGAAQPHNKLLGFNVRCVQ